MTSRNDYCNTAKYTATNNPHNFINASQHLKEKLLAQHQRAIDEIEFMDTDFYEDNIYDEPEYWHSAHYRSTGRRMPWAEK